MGYKIGTGLGKNNEGRVEPVESVVIPEGNMGLDGVMELKKKIGKKKKSKKTEIIENKESQELPEMEIFNFINNRLSDNTSKFKYKYSIYVLLYLSSFRK